MNRQSKQKRENKIKNWLVAIGICLGFVLMGSESEDLSTIWVNFVGIGLIVLCAYCDGAFRKEAKNGR